MPHHLNSSSSPEEIGPARKRKSHQKSRRGCRNCKLRRVKCDETRPICTKCTSFGVTCNYTPNTIAEDLDSHEGSILTFNPPSPLAVPGTSTIDFSATFTKAPVVTSLSKNGKKQKFQFEEVIKPGKVAIGRNLVPVLYAISDDGSLAPVDRPSLERLSRFHQRTVFSIGNEDTAPLFQKACLELACTYPYLMHVVQTLTSVHDRYLSPIPSPRQTAQESFHLTRAASLFSKALANPIKDFSPPALDALWATAALLGTTAISTIEASTPSEAWPLTSSSNDDLEWIRLSESKSAVWEFANPLRPDSIFNHLAQVKNSTSHVPHLFNRISIPEYGSPSLSPLWLDLFELDDFSTAENNPYFTSLHCLAQLLHIPYGRKNLIPYLSFIFYLPPAFMALLNARDPKALVVFAWWYAQICSPTSSPSSEASSSSTSPSPSSSPSSGSNPRDTAMLTQTLFTPRIRTETGEKKVDEKVWWLEKRAKLEFASIVLYMERYHWRDFRITRLMGWPRRACGLDKLGDGGIDAGGKEDGDGWEVKGWGMKF